MGIIYVGAKRHKYQSGNRSQRPTWGIKAAGRYAIAAERRRDRRLAQVRNVRLDDPTPEVLREYIKALTCYWCGSSPWVSLAIHTSHAHGISANDLRNLALLYKSNSFVSPEYNDELVQRAIRTKSVLKIKGKRRFGPHTFTVAGAISHHQREERFAALARRPEAQIQRLRANQINAERSRKPHPCTACGKMMPKANPKTCSPECRLEIRRQTAQTSSKTRDYSKYRRPHTCPECTRIIPTAKPKYCSPECIQVAQSRRKQFHPCTICGKDTHDYQKRTCSLICLKKARKQQGLRARHNLRPGLPGPRLQRRCSVCGVTFEDVPSRLRERRTCTNVLCKKIYKIHIAKMNLGIP